MTKIEYENLHNLNEGYFKELTSAAARVIESGWYVLGDEVRHFEEKFASISSSKFCVGVSNGMDALELAFEALDLPIGLEVITGSHSYIATILAIINNKLTPILAPTCSKTFNINVHEIEALITPNTSAICVTHMYGMPCEMEKVLQLAELYGLKIIEDCAQSHGSKYRGKHVGNFSDIGCFSFYPTKNIGALGDAGAIVTASEDFAIQISKLRNYGSKIKYHNECIGYNRRLDEIQASFLTVKLNHFHEYIKRKSYISEKYRSELCSSIRIQKQFADMSPVQHIFSIVVDQRDAFREYLQRNGIGTEVHYPVPVWEQECMQEFKLSDCNIAKMLSRQQVSIPSSIWLKEKELDYIIRVINEYFE